MQSKIKKRSLPAVLFCEIRPYQWTKNFFVFAPLFFGVKLLDYGSLIDTLKIFALFCIASSAVYVFNDIFDMQDDAKHQTKKMRPLPSGELLPNQAKILCFSLFCMGIASIWAANIPTKVTGLITAYFLINILYTIYFKTIPIVEIFLVSSGFVIRVIAGAIAIDVPFTDWILVSSGLLALLLVTGKRRNNLQKFDTPPHPKSALHHYTVSFLDNMISIVCGAQVVLYLSFCISDHSQAKYGPLVLLTSIPVMLGVFKFVHLVLVQNEGENPSATLFKDKMIFSNVLIWLALFVYIIYFR